MSSTRRDFLIGGLSAGAAAPLATALGPQWLRALGSAATSDRILVVLQIRGGWDFHNILIPADNPIYYAARPAIGIPKTSTLPVQSTASVYWHPALAPFKALLDRGDLAAVQNIGYPNPNLSHFESEKKWYAGDPSASTVTPSGWLSRYLKNGYSGGFQIPAMNLEGRLNDSFLGSRVPVLPAGRTPTQTVAGFQFAYDGGTPNDNQLQAQLLESNAAFVRSPQDVNLSYVARGIAGAVRDSKLLQTVGSNYRAAVTYPTTSLANTLQTMASFIIGGLQTQIYYTSTGGYDTHANQVVSGAPHTGNMANRLSEVANALKAFLDDIKAQGFGQKVVVMLFSEFSRRFGQNGSLGTDHGHGGVAFVAGEPVNAGLYGKYPDLSKATQPYANYYARFDQDSTDFRSLYATIVERWFGVPSAPVLGGTFPLLGLL